MLNRISVNQLWLPVLCVPLLLSCGKPAPSSEAAKPAGHVVAQVDTVNITLEELDAQLGLGAAGKGKSTDSMSARRRQVLDASVRFEVLAAEATRRGYDKTPEMQRAYKQQLINQLIQHEIAARGKPSDVSEAEAQAYYNAHTADYVTGEQVQVGQILVATEADANRVAAAAKALAPGDEPGFRKLVDKNSVDSASKSRGGDLGTLTRQSNLPRQIVDAAFALAPGGTSAPIAGTDGFHILRCQRKLPAMVRPFDQVMLEVKGRLAGLAHATQMEDWFATVKATHDVRLFEDRLQGLAEKP